MKFEWFSDIYKQTRNNSETKELVLLRTAQATKKFFLALVQIKMLAFAVLRCCENRKKALTQADRALGIKQCYNQGWITT